MLVRRFAVVLGLALCMGDLFGQELTFPDAETISNWTAPPYWTPAAAIGLPKPEADALSTQAIEALPSSPLPFVAINPCRLLDTRNNLNPLGGGGPFAVNETRTYTLAGACGLPAGILAASLNVTATNTGAGAFGHIKVWPADGAEPNVSTLNYPGAGATVANAAVVPLSNTGALKVKSGNASADVILDVNGYYAPISIVNSVNGQSGVVTMATLPAGSTGQTLRHNGSAWVANSALTSDGSNVAVTGSLDFANAVRVSLGGARFLTNHGTNSLFLGQIAGNASSITGANNVGIGNAALRDVSSGSENTAVGTNALEFLTTSEWNTAVGYSALASGPGNGPTGNTAVGAFALANSAGAGNTGVGSKALEQATGIRNTAIGNLAGFQLVSGSDNLYLGNEGVASESNTIRLGTGDGFHTRLFLAGVLGTSIGSALPMYINGVAQVGTVVSSARYKEDIRSMGDASERIFQLRPVTFRYKDHPVDPTQFGLIAEEVERVLPELVTRNAAGEPESVMYHELPAMLVNEIQKQDKRIEKQEKEIADLRALVEALSARAPAPECSPR